MNIGEVVLENQWGKTLLEVYIRHRRGNDTNREDSNLFYSIPAGERTASMRFFYTIGTLDFDYWWIKFTTIDGEEYQTNKYNFFCNITSSDDGTVVIKIDSNTKKMYVSFSSSSGCSQSLQKNN